jgi:hypothetical protein
MLGDTDEIRDGAWTQPALDAIGTDELRGLPGRFPVFEYRGLFQILLGRNMSAEALRVLGDLS